MTSPTVFGGSEDVVLERIPLLPVKALVMPAQDDLRHEEVEVVRRIKVNRFVFVGGVPSVRSRRVDVGSLAAAPAKETGEKGHLGCRLLTRLSPKKPVSLLFFFHIPSFIFPVPDWFQFDLQHNASKDGVSLADYSASTMLLPLSGLFLRA